MNCNKCIKAIPDFWSDELDIDDLSGFIKHIDSCEECREELTIDFLVREGLHSLESGNTFDLNEGLKNKMQSASHKLRLREKMKAFYYGNTCLVILLFALLVACLVLFK